MRHIVVTGANKGIGRAIVEAIVREHADTFVFVGSRDLERGRAAAADAGLPDGRFEVLELDVARDASVAEAARGVGERLARAGAKLYGLVNNAGIASGGGDFRAVLETNAVGVHRACEAFAPLLEPEGSRVVNVTSASGPIFVAKCSPERRRFFVDDEGNPEGARSWPRLRALVDACLATGGDPAALAAMGLGDGSAYGLSKAIANAYTSVLARERPRLVVNACTPGFIATDMTRHYAESAGKAPTELGMKTPAEGARAPMHLLFGALEGNGRFYGSDAKRSPVDRYREPGSPEYAGD